MYQLEHCTLVALIHHKEKHVTTRELIAITNLLHKGDVNVESVTVRRLHHIILVL